MRHTDILKNVLLIFTLLIVLIIMVSVAALFFVRNFSGVLENIFSQEIRYSLRLSIVTGCVSTILVICAAVPVAYLFSRYRFPGQQIIKTVLYLPIAFPEIVLGLCLLLFFGHPAVRGFLSVLGVDFVFSKPGIIVAQFFTAFPYAIRIIKTVFDSIDPQQELVSRSLGYSQLRTIFTITLPLAKNGIIAAMAISFARCVGAFGSVLILAGGTRMYTETLPIALYLNLSYGNMDLAIAAGLMLVVIAFIGIYIIEAIESRSGDSMFGIVIGNSDKVLSKIK
ncbi:MAG: ABC transporter permease [Candidatus Omnitrophota bacterium]